MKSPQRDARMHQYLKKALALLSGVVVPKSYQQWEVGSSDRQS